VRREDSREEGRLGRREDREEERCRGEIGSDGVGEVEIESKRRYQYISREVVI
jgi:hypothetical protein